MKPNYPSWVCAKCGLKHGNHPASVSTWHINKCDVCGESLPVTEPRDFGHLKDGWEKEKSNDCT